MERRMIVNLSPHLKRKIYNEFHQTISDINYIFGCKEEYFFEVLEEAFDEGVPIKMRQEIDYTIQSFRLDLSKALSNII